MNLSAEILRMFGWVVEFTVPDYPKCIICVAPHTSNWDFILGELAIHAVGRKVGFMMKSSWFFFPLGPIFKALGGIPVERKHKKNSLVESMVAIQIRIAPDSGNCPGRDTKENRQMAYRLFKNRISSRRTHCLRRY